MMIKQGIPVSPGVAIGPAFIMGNEDYRIPQRFVRIDDVEKELQRLDAAIEQVCFELGEHEELASDRLGKQYGAIFAAHQQLIQDPKMISEIRELIQDKCFSRVRHLQGSRTIRQAVSKLGEPILCRTLGRYCRPSASHAETPLG